MTRDALLAGLIFAAAGGHKPKATAVTGAPSPLAVKSGLAKAGQAGSSDTVKYDDYEKLAREMGGEMKAQPTFRLHNEVRLPTSVVSKHWHGAHVTRAALQGARHVPPFTALLHSPTS